MNKTTKILLGIVVIILIIWAISAKKSTTDTASLEPIRIGASFTLSGPVALVGDLQKAGAAIAVKDINDKGGINGRPIELVMEDNGYDSKMTLSAYQAHKLKNIKFFIADGSPVAASLRPAVIADGNFIFVPAATAPTYFDGNNRSCRISLTAKNFGPGFAQILKQKGYTKVATFFPDNEYGRGFAQEFSKAFMADGGKIVIEEFYNAASTGDYRTSLTKLKAKSGEIDAIVLSHVSNTIEPLFKQIAEIGLKKQIVTDYYTVNNPALKDLSLVEGIELVDYEYSKFDLPTDSQAIKSFKDTYRKNNSSDPTIFSAGIYDGITLISEAISKVGEDPAKVGEYISSLQNYQGITGTYSFNSDCEVSRNMLFKKVVGGKVVDIK